MKRKRIWILLSALVFAILATLAWPTFAPPPPGGRGRRPQANPAFELVLVDSQTGRPFPPGISLLSVPCGVAFDTWLYVSNPSNNLTTTYLNGLRQPLHTVDVQELTLVVTNPDGSEDTYNLGPEDSDVPMYDYRWDPIVNPGEESLVFFIGWTFPLVCDDPSLMGTYGYEYTLTAEFEDVEYVWTEDFEVDVTP